MTVCYYHVKYEFQVEYTLYSLHECQGTPYSKQGPYLKFDWNKAPALSKEFLDIHADYKM